MHPLSREAAAEDLRSVGLPVYSLTATVQAGYVTGAWERGEDPYPNFLRSHLSKPDA